MKTEIKALYTLSNNENIYVSKGKVYDLHYENDKRYIIDNTGEKMFLSFSEMTTRFEKIS